MIDIENEEVMSLSEAAALLPCGRTNRTPHINTLYSYTTNGCRGVVLESVQIGSRRCTSKQAVRRFVNTLTAKVGTTKAQRSCRRTDDARTKAVEAELDRLGV